MTNEPIDPRIDKMIASLYGELPEAEERAFRRLLEKDDELRAEWEELQGSRNLLAGWEVEERVPSFVLLEGEREESGREREGWLGRLFASFRNFGAAPAWGLAAAAVLLLVLTVAGFRVERVGNGIAFRFGEPTEPEAVPAQELGGVGELAATSPGGGFSDESFTTDDFPGDGFAVDGFGADAIVPVSSDVYLTKAEFDAYNNELVQSLVMLLNEYGERRDEGVTDLMQAVYSRMNSQQIFDYQQLNEKIDALGVEFLIDRTRREQSIDDILDERLGPVAPRELTTDTEE